MHYLDSNAFIYPALYDGPKATNAAELLADIVAGRTKGATASLTLDEVIWIIGQEATRDDGIAQGERLLKLPNLRILAVDGPVLMRSIKQLRAYDHVTPRDAIHLATMGEHGIHSIVSDDADFDAVESVERVPLESLDERT
jgi:predicted nucleic acid-binding protein